MSNFILFLDYHMFGDIRFRMKELLCFFLFLFLWCHCTPEKECRDYLLDDHIFVHEFPRTFYLSGGNPVDFDVIGVLSFRIADTLLLVSTANPEGFRTIISLPSETNRGSYLQVGNGPLEFTQRISVGASIFFETGGHWYETLYDSPRGRFYYFDLTETIRRQEPRFSLVADSLPDRAFNFIPVGSDFYFIRSIAPRSSSSYRFFLRNGKPYTTKELDLLNRPYIHDRPGVGKHASLLSSSFQISPDRKKLLECPHYFGLINIIPVDTVTRGKTLCLEREPLTFEKLEIVPRQERIVYTQVLRAYPAFFAVLQKNESWASSRRAEGKDHNLLLFDWDGNPLAELKLDCRCICFDIDFRNSELYVVDNEDTFRRYDLSSVLSELDLIRNSPD